MAKRTEGARLSPKLISLAVAACFATGTALANPTGPTVVNGQVTISQSGNLLSITNSPNSIINWQSFSIGANEITRFLQQSAASAVMNRVTGPGNPSAILGALQSNGRVFLINPSGIVFGAGSQVDVAGLVASSLNLSNADFLAGRLRFTEVPGAGAVVNQGAINAAAGGQVYLVGPSVTNSGVITTPQGEVVLAAGNSVELVNPGTPNLRVEIAAPDNEARNLGQIVADAGRVGIYAGLINHSGTIRADSAQVTDDGRVVLRATRNTTVEAGSSITANGPSGGQVSIQSGDTTLVGGAIEARGATGQGGTVQVLGNLVGVMDGASINVSGETGGGTVLVGGDFQGRNPDVQNAFRTFLAPNATINADATGAGNGGKVIVWSDDATRAYGAISARGGSRSGDGGLVEVSSKGWLDFHARVDTRAPNGRTGTLLLDPNDVEICSTSCGGSGGVFSAGISGGSGGSPAIFSAPTIGTSEILWSDIDSQLGASNVIITTSGADTMNGDITVRDSHALTNGNLLQLVAHRNVNINGSISGPGPLNVFAGWDGMSAVTPVVQQGVGNITVNSDVSMGGNVLFKAGNNIHLDFSDVIVSHGSSSRSIIFSAGNQILVESSDVKVDVSGGESTAATINFTAGAGGISVVDIEGNSNIEALGGAQCCGIPGGPATINLTASGSITVEGSAIRATGGSVSEANGGNAAININSGSNILVDSSDIVAQGGRVSSAGGRGGSGTIQLIATGNIDVLDSFGIHAIGDRGPLNGGSGDVTLSAGGNINVQRSYISAVGGGEGSTGGMARILMAANGDISVANSIVQANSQYGSSFTPDTGTSAQVSMIGRNVSVNQSGISADGGEGLTNGGAGSVNLLAAAGSLSIDGGEGIRATGGTSSGFGRGGDAAMTLSAAGNVSINNAGPGYGGQGIVARAGSTSSQATGGNASVLITADGGGVTSTRSHIESRGGDGQSAGGSAVTELAALGGGIVLDGSGGTPLSVYALGGQANALGGTGGTAELNLVSVGATSIINEYVYADGGYASNGRGGDATVNALALGGFSMMNSTVGSFAGFGGQQGGNSSLAIAGANITIEHTGSLSPTTLIARGGGSNTAGTLGSAVASLAALAPSGTINLNNERVDVSGGEFGSLANLVFGPASISLFFPTRTSDGFFVNGEVNAITGGTGTPPSFGFFVNGLPAILNENFFVFYGGGLPSFDAQLIASLAHLEETLMGNIEEASGLEDDENHKKKKETVCK